MKSAARSRGAAEPARFPTGPGAESTSLLPQAARPSVSAPENLTTGFAMSPFFPSTQMPPIQLSGYSPCRVLRGERPRPRARAEEPCCPREIWLNQQPKFFLSVLIYPIIAVGCFAMSNVLWRWAFHILYCFLLTKCCLDFCSFLK